MEYVPMISDCHEWFAWMDSRMLLCWDYPSYDGMIEKEHAINGLALLL